MPSVNPRLSSTGSSNKTIVFTGDGHYTVEPPPLCPGCQKTMDPLTWLCGGCGGVR